MEFSFGIGDAFLISKLAWNVAQVLTKGRKSAPREFHELEDQLYSLVAALTALKNAFDNQGTPNSTGDSSTPQTDHLLEEEALGETLKKVLTSCGRTLKHLEETMKKYGAMVEPHDVDETTMSKWAKVLTKDYKKIAWTTEKGNLDSLRNQITIHTNSLDLILGVISNSRTKRIEKVLHENSHMMKEIYDWFIESMTITDIEVHGITHRPPATPNPAPPATTFEVCLGQDMGGARVICSRASLHEHWNLGISKENLDDQYPLFTCHCSLSSGMNQGDHSSALSIYAFSPFTFPFSLVGSQKSWMLYKAADTLHNTMVAIIIRNVALNYIQEFEQIFIRTLSEAKAELMFSRSMNNMLAHIEPHTQQAYVLNLRGNVSSAGEDFESITFTVGTRTYKRSMIKGVDLLHYRAVKPEFDSPSSTAEVQNPFCEYAEILLFYDETEDTTLGDISRNLLQVRSNTSMSFSEQEAQVAIRKVKCLGYSNEACTSTIENVDVNLQFARTETARDFYDKLEAMRLELFALSLEYPQIEENVVLHL
ncbi:unnamed protein product [Clonostachys byssicola]|uniref:NACHT-NTPase and P-loop NTPases N-terminal domain-containing protein n=1 Tax=Clonostachys byssicola TaxID=160290 RepID=A0A9N9UW16_9HYPO|nr:unnamed protein product [Clonostachys byssicola]